MHRRQLRTRCDERIKEPDCLASFSKTAPNFAGIVCFSSSMNDNIAAFDKTDFTQAAAKRISRVRPLVLPEAGQEADHWNDRLLRARRQRPRRRPTNQRYDLPTLHCAPQIEGRPLPYCRAQASIRAVQKNKVARLPLMGWSGRAPAPPASQAGEGRQSQG